MGCLNSTNNTKVQPFDSSRSNGHIQNSQEDGQVQTPKQNGHAQTSQRGKNLVTSQKESTIQNLQQNGHIPSSQIQDTPRETLGQLPNQKNIYTNNAGTDTRIQETQEVDREGPESTIIESISIRQEPSSGLIVQGDPQIESSRDQNTSARTTDGNISQRSSNRDPVVIPTMPVSEEDFLKSHYTIKEISLHNNEKKYIDIFPFKDKIYSTAKFKKAIKHVVELKYEKFEEEGKQVEPYDYEDFNDKWMSSPIYLVMFSYPKMYVRFADIKSELSDCKVAEVFKDDEQYKDIINDSKTILKDLKSNSQLTVYTKEYKELLERFLEICDKANSDPESLLETNIPKGKDPNTVEFLLPDKIQANPKVLRKWIETWEQFITEIPKEGVWTELPDNVVNAMNDPLDLQDICRVSSDGLPSFDFTVEGEAAWKVLELDIVKNDKATEVQERVWRSRENRSDLNDPTFILKRQTRLEMYFINKYEWESSKLDPYRGFASRLQRGWKEFQGLCKEDEFSIIPEDEY